jgi:alpha-beta hydrolase superfamily lysophospholipase
MDRRNVLTAGGVLAAAGVPAAGRPEVTAAGRAEQQNFLFVHGAWHAATHWNEVTTRLAAMGHSALAIDLPGSGNLLAWTP